MKIVLSNKLRLSDMPDEMVKEIVGKLSFVNPKWIENQRMGRWNRGTPKTLKFYRKIKGNGLLVPRGYMRQLILMARRYSVAVDVEDRRRRKGDIPFTFHGSLKPFQNEAVKQMMAKDFGTLCAPTGSGKTVMALSIAAKRRQPTLVMVHTRELANQWLERIETFLHIPKKQIGLIGAGKQSIGEWITIGLVQSLYTRAGSVSKQIGHLIVDECHRTPSRTFTVAVTAFDSLYMLGLSATPWRRDRLSKLIFWHLGDVHHEVKKEDLVAKGHILDFEVISRQTEFRPYYDPVDEYSKMLSELTSDDGRNHLICNDIEAEYRLNREIGTCLVLSDRKRHCETLQAILKHRHGVNATLLTGDLGMRRRRVVVEELSLGNIGVLIATGQLVGEGFDHAGLSTLFLTTPVSFSGRLLQYLGRILRPAEGIDKAKVYDYVDIHVPPLVAAAKARMRVYGETSAG